MRTVIQYVMSMYLVFSLLLPVNASGIGSRGTLIPNDTTGIVDSQLYEYLTMQINQTQLYSNDLIDIEELTITNYEYEINSIQGLKNLKMPNLKILNIAVNTLNNIDDVLAFPSLEELNLYYPDIKQLPDTISKLSNLTSLQVEGGNLAQLPASLFDMIRLKSLVLKQLPMKELSNQITKLMYLEELVIDDVSFTRFPAEISQLRSLKHLELNGMGLSSLPTNMESMLKLEVLRLEDNEFKGIPDVLFDLLNVQYLSFKNNKIETIDPQIQTLRRLRELDLSVNKLQTLPIEVINLPSLKILDLANNEWDCLASEFNYLSLTNVSNVFDGYGIKMCGVVDTTPVTIKKAPVLRVQGNMEENFMFTNQEVIIESDQPVNFVINEVANVARDEAMAFSLEGNYTVSGINEYGLTSNSLSFTIDKTNPTIRITDNQNDLGIYYIDVAIDANEDGYFVVNGQRQSTLSRLLLLSEKQHYTVTFIDLAGNESNMLDLVLQAKADKEIPGSDDDKILMYVLFIVLAVVMGGGTYFFLQRSASDEE